MPAKSGTSIQVIERMARLLDALAAHSQPATLKVLSAYTGLHPSTAHRILGAMGSEGFVERDAAGTYRLGFKLMQLGSRLRSDAHLEQQCLPLMEALRDRIGETVNLTVREGDEVVYVARAATTRMMRVEHVIGSRAPLHVTAVGKLMLGETSEEECRAYATRTRLPHFTPNTIANVDDLIAEARLCCAQGYALDDEEAERGVGCIGVLVRDGSGGAVAGLSISAPIERRRDEWIPLVMEAGRRISERLGYMGEAEAAPQAAGQA